MVNNNRVESQESERTSSFAALHKKARQLLRGGLSIAAAAAAFQGISAADSVRAKAPAPILPTVTPTPEVIHKDFPDQIGVPNGTYLTVDPFNPTGRIKVEGSQVLKVSKFEYGNYLVTYNNVNRWVLVDSTVSREEALEQQAAEKAAESVAKTENVTKTYVVIKAGTANIRSSDNSTSDANIVNQAHKGDQLEVIKSDKNDQGESWYQIYFIDSEGTQQEGYVSAKVTEDETIQKVTEVTAIEPESADNVITNTNALIDSPVITGTGIGGELTDSEIISRAKEKFSPEVTIDETGDYPIAKFKKFIVGEFLNGEWQDIIPTITLSDEDMANYPDLEEKIIDNQKVKVQTTLGYSVIIARWDADLDGGKGKWVSPAPTAWELTQMTVELHITSQRDNGDKDIVSPVAPIEYGWDLTRLPKADDDGKVTIILRGMALASPEIVQLPIERLVNGEWVKTGWSLQRTILPVASLNEAGQWTINFVDIGVTQPLVDSKGSIYRHNFVGQPTTSDGVRLLTLDNGFQESAIYLAGYKASDVQPASTLSDTIKLGTPIGMFINAVTPGNEQTINDDKSFIDEQLNGEIFTDDGFAFQPDAVPTPDQVHAIGIALEYGWLPDSRIKDLVIIDDDLSTALITTGLNEAAQDTVPKFWGNVSIVAAIK